MNTPKKPLVKDRGYNFKFPLPTFSDKIINFDGETKRIRNYLEGRNVFYFSFDKKRKRILIDRISSLNSIVKFVLECIFHEMPAKKVISIFTNGSYLYGDADYVPGDIDAGIIVEGNAFDHLVNKYEIPSSIRKQLPVPVKDICFSIYGEKNMTKGTPIQDTFRDATLPSVIHKRTTLRELSVAYWRDVVIWGKDFNYLKNNEKNVIVTLGRMINDCHTRLLSYGYKKEDKKTLFRKIVTRLIETNLFLRFFYPNLKIDLEYLFKLPSRVLYEVIYYDEMKRLFNSTLINFMEVKKLITK